MRREVHDGPKVGYDSGGKSAEKGQKKKKKKKKKREGIKKKRGCMLST